MAYLDFLANVMEANFVSERLSTDSRMAGRVAVSSWPILISVGFLSIGNCLMFALCREGSRRGLSPTTKDGASTVRSSTYGCVVTDSGVFCEITPYQKISLRAAIGNLANVTIPSVSVSFHFLSEKAILGYLNAFITSFRAMPTIGSLCGLFGFGDVRR